MIRFRRSKITLLLFLLCTQIFGQESDLFSEKNTADFAHFLFQTNQYKYAAQEYERLTFMFPSNQNYKVSLLKSYRFANEYSKGIDAFKHLSPPKLSDVQQEYVKLNLLDNNKPNLKTMLEGLDPESSFRNNLDLTLRIISIPEKPINLEGINTQRVDLGLLNLYYESSKIRYKSPFFAATLSTLVPGSGKVYCGRWKDGLMSVLFIGATGIQASRGFYKKGYKSIYGWIMGSMSLGFYIGNIYGSVKAAKNYNAHQNSIFIDKATHYYIDHF
jgi:hypothetical protein